MNNNAETQKSVMQYVMCSGLVCQVSPFLPVDEMLTVCDIETKAEITIATGKLINCIKMGNRLLMTQGLYDAIKNQ